MIYLNVVLEVHQILVEQFGGLQGVRDSGLLQSAIERPFSGLGQAEFYEKPEEKAGAILESIVKNHPFMDGKKRTGYVLMRLILMEYGKDVMATQDEKYNFIIDIATGLIDFEEIVTWIKAKIC